MRRRNEREIVELDKDFDFSCALKDKYCTLKNFRLFEIKIEVKFKVDGIDQEIKYPSTLYQIKYREFMNPNWFILEEPNEEKNLYWSSSEKAIDWFEENQKKLGLKELDEEKSFQIARRYLKDIKKTQKLLENKK